MDDAVYLYYRLYDGHSVLASKSPFSTQHTNVSSIDVQDIFPPYTGETGSKADVYPQSQRCQDPPAAATTVDIDNGPSTKMASAIRVVVRPGAPTAAQGTSSATAAKDTSTRLAHQQLTRLFPNPGPPPVGVNTPSRLPGVTPNSTAVVRGYLQRDYEIHDAFFSAGGGHNHTPFHMLTEYALGAAPAHIEAIWKVHLTIEKPAFASPGSITAATFSDHLGDRRYYQAYLKFFSEEVLKKNDTAATLEEWLFSSKANFDGKGPQMLNRLLGGHPAPHALCRLWNRVRAAVHQLGNTLKILPQKMFPMPPSRQDHAFSIASRILLDDRFDGIKPMSLDDVLAKFGDAIYGYAAQWTVDGANAKEVENKVQELMHLVTTSLRLSSLMAIITSPTSKSLFLRAYFARSLGHWISRGRRPLNVRSFFASSSPLALTPNPWMQLIQSALVHPDDHLCKVIRTLAHYGTVYGAVAPGTFKMTELKDSEVIDGTLFIRAAGLTMQKMGRVREGEKDRYWTNDGNHADDPDHLL
ncbi:hypothetical protein C8J57DRAFT_1367498 [Mycena rebaudengoi]|nr:hypothetical protein C8J57DRAFT_1367498 [Mycena rebaudengoi]